MHEHGDSKDILGRAYEYCLSKFAEAEGKLAGEFYTPACIVKTLVNVLEPYAGRVYDPCCGSGGMFVQSAKFIESHAGNINQISVYGQDSNPTTWKMAQMNLAIRGIEADLGQYNADTFFNDCHPTLKADFILANPPFNLSDWGADKLADDVRWKFGTPPNGNANFAWIQHIIHHLAPAGRAGVVLANGSLSSQSGSEGEIRRKLVEADLVDCIVAMPSQLFYTTQIPVSIWFFNKAKKQKGKTLFIDARNLGTMVTRKLRELTDGADGGDIMRIANTYKAFAEGTLADEKGFCAVVDIQKIAEQEKITAIVEGSNLDDNGDYRPGLTAVAELGIHSPLRSIGFTKEDIRALSRHFGLPTWNKQSFACLSSRFVYGETISREKLGMVDKAEQLLLDLGFHQVRVRIHGMIARIEIMPEEFPKIIQEDIRSQITESFKNFGFTYVSLDLTGYRTGSMNETLAK
jgi:hypothetical protein